VRESIERLLNVATKEEKNRLKMAYGAIGRTMLAYNEESTVTRQKDLLAAEELFKGYSEELQAKYFPANVQPIQAAQGEIKAPDLADVLALSLARVGQLARDGIITKQPSGRYLQGAITQYIKWYRAKREEKQGPPGDDFREMLIEQQFREKKRDNDIAENLVAPKQLLADALSAVGMKIVAQMEALPLEMKRANPRLSGHDIMVVKKSIARCCNAIAETNID